MNPQGYTVKKTAGATKRFVQTLNLRNDAALIAAYRQCHSPEGIWPEILQGIKEAGVVEMEIYLLDTHLVMIVELFEKDDWAEVMTRVAAGPRQAEWEAFVAQYQRAASNASSTEKWQQMERIFYLYS